MSMYEEVKSGRKKKKHRQRRELVWKWNIAVLNKTQIAVPKDREEQETKWSQVVWYERKIDKIDWNPYLSRRLDSRNQLRLNF